MPIATWGISALKLILPDNFPRTADIHMDGSALLFTTLASVATGLIFGLAPAFRASRTDVTKSLNEGDRGTEGFGRNRLRSVLVISQVALAVILLIGTGLMRHSFVRLLHVDPGFKPGHLLTMEISLPDARYPNSQKAVKEKGPILANRMSVATVTPAPELPCRLVHKRNARLEFGEFSRYGIACRAIAASFKMCLAASV